MMKWEAESKGYSCNDCYLSMQNCHDLSICCEDETGLCDCFEEIPTERRTDDGIVLSREKKWRNEQNEQH